MREGGFLDRTLKTLTGQDHPNVDKRAEATERLRGLRASLEALQNFGGDRQISRHNADGETIVSLEAKIKAAQDELLRMPNL